jgi:NADP-dependent aldehyde dehydrogenase
MGWCQGRVCGYATACLAAGGRALDAADLRPLARRPLCAPVSLGELADLDDSMSPVDRTDDAAAPTQ